MYLLDTNHCSRLIDGEEGVVGRMESLGDAYVATCSIVAGELCYMACNSAREEENRARVSSFLSDIDVHPVDEKVAFIYGRMKAALVGKFGPKDKMRRKTVKLKSIGVDENDLWIAAVAVVNGLKIVSSDRGFARIAEVEISLEIECWHASG